MTDGSADGVPNAQSWENADKEIDENLYTGVNICFIPKAKIINPLNFQNIGLRLAQLYPDRLQCLKNLLAQKKFDNRMDNIVD